MACHSTPGVSILHIVRAWLFFHGCAVATITLLCELALGRYGHRRYRLIRAQRHTAATINCTANAPNLSPASTLGTIVSRWLHRSLQGRVIEPFQEAVDLRLAAQMHGWNLRRHSQADGFNLCAVAAIELPDEFQEL